MTRAASRVALAGRRGRARLLRLGDAVGWLFADGSVVTVPIAARVLIDRPRADRPPAC